MELICNLDENAWTRADHTVKSGKSTYCLLFLYLKKVWTNCLKKFVFCLSTYIDLLGFQTLTLFPRKVDNPSWTRPQLHLFLNYFLVMVVLCTMSSFSSANGDFRHQIYLQQVNSLIMSWNATLMSLLTLVIMILRMSIFLPALTRR